MALDLKDVTICAADCVTPQLAARALNISTALCDFGDAILFSDTASVSPSDRFRHIKIDRLESSSAYSYFCLKQMASYITTPYVLVVQWDGYVLDPSAWQSGFRDYDYIGAQWLGHKDLMRVGNGGFSLRSLKLLKVMADDIFPFVPNVPEDVQIGRLYRPQLEKDYGIKFAPEEVADRFSYERDRPDVPTFGFHGLYNLWRYVNDAEMMAMAATFPPHTLKSIQYFELMIEYAKRCKLTVVKYLYKRALEQGPAVEIWQKILMIVRNAIFANTFKRIYESLVSDKNRA